MLLLSPDFLASFLPFLSPSSIPVLCQLQSCSPPRHVTTNAPKCSNPYPLHFSSDGVCRVWDARTKTCVHVLSGHTNTVCAIQSQSADPQVVTGSVDTHVRLWDLAAGKATAVLTHHKKSVRALALHPTEFAFASGGADSIRKWRFPDGDFLQACLLSLQ